MPTTVRTLTAQLRDEIRDSGMSVRELGKKADVDDGMIHRFLSDERGLTTATVDRLALVLGLKLVDARGRTRTRARAAKVYRA